MSDGHPRCCRDRTRRKTAGQCLLRCHRRHILPDGIGHHVKMETVRMHLVVCLVHMFVQGMRTCLYPGNDVRILAHRPTIFLWFHTVYQLRILSANPVRAIARNCKAKNLFALASKPVQFFNGTSHTRHLFLQKQKKNLPDRRAGSLRCLSSCQGTEAQGESGQPAATATGGRGSRYGECFRACLSGRG